jgi:mannobiose 2-epimerase
MLNNIVNRDTHHFHYFQDIAWKPTTSEVSFGHDIEGSWLMMEAAEVLNEPEAHENAQPICVNMARACLEEGIRPDGGMNSEYDPAARHTSERLSWWEQNETVVGFLNAWQMTGEEKFMDASLKCMELIEKRFVDKKHGGWFAVLNRDYTPMSQLKQSGFICPYHNARMCVEVIERFRKVNP